MKIIFLSSNAWYSIEYHYLILNDSIYLLSAGGLLVGKKIQELPKITNDIIIETFQLENPKEIELYKDKVYNKQEIKLFEKLLTNK